MTENREKAEWVRDDEGRDSHLIGSFVALIFLLAVAWAYLGYYEDGQGQDGLSTLIFNNLPKT